jgi:tyrosyl-tRNA synthetase
MLVGTDGVKKMSKSLDNYIGLTDSADEMYGKTMSIPDAALPNWLDLAADFSSEEIKEENAKLAKGENPRNVKASLAERIVRLYHGAEAAQAAAENFVARFKNKEIPDDMPVLVAAGRTITGVLAEAFAVSKTEARRLIEQNGVKIDGAVAADPLTKVSAGNVLQKGKRGFVKIA